MAVAKFITEPQTIHLAPVDAQAFLESAKKALGKHKNAMDKLGSGNSNAPDTNDALERVNKKYGKTLRNLGK